MKLMLRHKLAMGDTVLFTALCRDIALTYPGKYEIVVETNFREVFAHHPYARIRRPDEKIHEPGTWKLDIGYRDGILAANKLSNPRKVHMLSWYHADFARRSKLPLVPLYPKACIPLTEQEQVPLVPGGYWLIVAGGKLDATVKVWRPSYWQDLVNQLSDHGIKCVQTGAKHNGHYHPHLDNVIDMVGRCHTTREFFNLVYNAQGVICPITGAMHVAAAYDKPCVVIAGGREAPWWEGYTNEFSAFGPRCEPVAVEHCYLHTLGQLDCCRKNGCWKHRVKLIGNHDKFDKADKLCKLPVLADNIYAPKCLDMITPAQVLAAVRNYEGKPKPHLGNPERHSGNPELIRLPGFEPVPLPPDEPDISVFPSPPAVNLVQPKPVGERIEAMHNSVLGDKLTVCVLCYGPHVDLARKCLGSIYRTVPAEYLDVRVGCNAVEPATMNYLKTLPITKIYDMPENPGKYKTMSRMFYDSTCPITTEYVCWLDDDVFLCASDWLQRVATTINANHHKGIRMYGNLFVHDILAGSQDKAKSLRWFHDAPWWRGRNLLVRGTLKEANNGSVIRFPAGWFWLLSTGVLKQCVIPDPRLVHNGDIAVAEQVRQMGWGLGQINRNKELAWCPTRENGGRRGTINKAFPWHQ